jgi:hypothetical protein
MYKTTVAWIVFLTRLLCGEYLKKKTKLRKKTIIKLQWKLVKNNK